VVQPSLRAVIADLLGDDPERPDPGPARLPLAEALAACGRGELVAARDGDSDVVVAVLGDGRAYVLPDRCPHDGRPLSDGFVDGDRIVCARHGRAIDPCSGGCLAGG